MTIIEEIREMAISTRLMRLADAIRKDVTIIYKEHGIGFESKWFPVLYVLSKKLSLSVIEVAAEIGYTHQSVMSLVKEMQKSKLIKISSDKSDKRKRILSLTAKGIDTKKQLDSLCQDITAVAKKICDNDDHLLNAIEQTEKLLADDTFYDRYKKLEAKRLKSK
jgi:MarR family transcriptional regulator, repressor for mepA